ncbi:hypothetical protein QWY99_18390 [Flavobacterium branchiarum]|uniref:Uncharacterized protein n=1 Tax=Flavobacterium branchiarum TaxID=1114870 RepID=A0ABV5FIY6_9FLAO|nr:hypothetical protein [Flavobacterium branchiarum]MDN3675007.1 hypothetical protein [Flavobacterium branchiarum]
MPLAYSYIHQIIDKAIRLAIIRSTNTIFVIMYLNPYTQAYKATKNVKTGADINNL